MAKFFKKNYLRVLSIVAVLLFTGTLCQAQATKKSTNADSLQTSLPRPKWINNFPMVMIGNWDVKPTFRRRVGGNPVWQENEYKEEHTEARVKKFKDMGATMIMLHFYKGFGLEAEKEEIEDTKKLAVLCKKYGLKIGVYVGATIAYESFLTEYPQAKDWFPPDHMGLPLTYGSQTYRKLVYFQHPGYKAYIKKVLKIAIQDIKADLIHFDNTSLQGPSPVFYHPLAAENFRTFLTKKYSTDLLKKRFGFSVMTNVEPPKYNYTKEISRIDDPLYQDWMDFRCQQLADYYGEMERYIRGLDPEVAVECNPHGLTPNNTMWEYSVDFPRLLAHTDFFWTEGEQTGLDESGALRSKIRTYKMARTLNNRVFTNTADNKLKMAESMAYNRQGMGLIAGTEEMEGALPERSYILSPDEKAYIGFFQKNFNYYKDVDNIADVAILHSYTSMAFNSDRPHASTSLFEQSLIQARVPFDIIFDDQLKNLSKYKVLVLADQESMSDAELDLVRAFVKNGGGLIATEHTSLYTDWHLRKATFSLNDLFAIDPPEWHNRSTPEDILQIPTRMLQVGKGKVVYIPEVIPSDKKVTGVPVAGRSLKLPLNFDDLIKAVNWASGNSISLKVDAPVTVTAELLEKTDHSAMLLHLVNFDTKNPPLQNLHVEVNVTAGKKVKQVTVLSPDGNTNDLPKFEQSDRHLTFTVRELATYDVVIIKY